MGAHLSWILFGIAFLFLSEGVRKYIKTFVQWWMRPTQARQNVVVQPPATVLPERPSIPTTAQPSPSWLERIQARREAKRKARAEAVKNKEGELLLEVETWRYVQIIFIFLLIFAFVVILPIYYSSEIVEFWAKFKTSGTIGSPELPWAVVKTREWMLYSVQVPLLGLLIAMFIIMGYGARGDTSLLFFMIMLAVFVVVGVWINHWQGVNIFRIPASRELGVAPIPLGLFIPLIVATVWFFALKQKPDAVLALLIVLGLAIFL